MNSTKWYLLAACLFTGMHPSFAQAPPATWQEHWFEHVQLLSRVYYDSDVAVYHDADVNPANTWMNDFSGDIWRYAKSVYGNFGSENRLYAIFHTGKYGGGHPSTYFDASHDYRNVIDIGTGGTWDCMCGWNIGVIAHEISHIVELGSKGIHGSPAFGIWGDSKWAEIFTYDVYLHLGMTSEAADAYNGYLNTTDNFPRADTHWFRDWFYPIYSNYGQAAVLNRYFDLLAEYFPRNGTDYSRGMNMGEFVHFWSGAAGVDLKSLATTAFGWTTEYETQYTRAKAEFPFGTSVGVTVYTDCDYTGTFAGLASGSYNLSDLQARGIGNDAISSIRVRNGYRVVGYYDINYGGTSITITADNACLVDEGFNDKITSLVVSQVSLATAPAERFDKTADNLVQINAINVPDAGTHFASKELYTGVVPVVAAGPGQNITTKIAMCMDYEKPDEEPKNAVQLYPNPSISELHLQLQPEWNGSTLSIMDEQGIKIWEGEFTNQPLSINNLKPGIYSLQVYKDGAQIIKRFIKK